MNHEPYYPSAVGNLRPQRALEWARAGRGGCQDFSVAYLLNGVSQITSPAVVDRVRNVDICSDVSGPK